MMNGESAVLWPTSDNEYEGGSGWDQREPVINHVTFAQQGFDRRRADDKVVHARRIDLPERTRSFPAAICVCAASSSSPTRRPMAPARIPPS